MSDFVLGLILGAGVSILIRYLIDKAKEFIGE